MSDLVEVTPLTASWPARTWSPGEKVTAGMMNGVRDQLNELHSLISGGVGSTFAYTDRVNTFTQQQMIQYATPRFALVDTSVPVDKKRFDWVVSGQILYLQALTDAAGWLANLVNIDRAGNTTIAGGISAAGRVVVGPIGSPNAAAIRYESVDRLGVVSGDNARYAGVTALNFTAMSTSNSLPDLTLTGNTNFAYGVRITAPDASGVGLTIVSGGASITGSTVVNTLTVNVGGINITAGGLTVTGNCVVGGNIHNTAGYYYPGEVNTGGAYQGTWFLASHSTYGLYMNTGLYLAGGITAAGAITSSSQVSGIGFQCRSGTAGGWTGSSYNFYWDGNVHCYIDASYIGYIQWASDARLKHDFTPLVGSLDKIRQMRPGSFFFYRDVEYRPHLGLLAQDVMEVAPELVRKVDMATDRTPDGYYQINYTEMIPMLVAAIQELEQKVDRLQKEH